MPFPFILLTIQNKVTAMWVYIYSSIYNKNKWLDMSFCVNLVKTVWEAEANTFFYTKCYMWQTTYFCSKCMIVAELLGLQPFLLNVFKKLTWMASLFFLSENLPTAYVPIETCHNRNTHPFLRSESTRKQIHESFW